MSKVLVLEDELHGFHPGSEGNAVVIYASTDKTVTISTKYTVPFEDDADGWDWGLGGTRLNVQDTTALRDYLTAHLIKIGA